MEKRTSEQLPGTSEQFTTAYLICFDRVDKGLYLMLKRVFSSTTLFAQLYAPMFEEGAGLRCSKLWALLRLRQQQMLLEVVRKISGRHWRTRRQRRARCSSSIFPHVIKKDAAFNSEDNAGRSPSLGNLVARVIFFGFGAKSHEQDQAQWLAVRASQRAWSAGAAAPFAHAGRGGPPFSSLPSSLLAARSGRERSHRMRSLSLCWVWGFRSHFKPWPKTRGELLGYIVLEDFRYWIMKIRISLRVTKKLQDEVTQEEVI